MPRRLLRDRRIVVDEWEYLEAPAAEPGAGEPAALIVPFARWRSDPDAWLRRNIRLGILFGASLPAEQLAPDLPKLSLIALEFSGPSDGRAYTQARQLRERWKFTQELRATGYVRLDQLFFLARCGFTSFELPDADLDAAASAFATFSAEYQASNDAGLGVALRHR